MRIPSRHPARRARGGTGRGLCGCARPTDPRSLGSRGIVLLAGLTPAGALDLLDAVAADARLVCATWIREPTQPQFAAVRAIERARLEPNGLHANLAPFDGTADAAAAVLGLHMSVLRTRTPAQRRAASALREHGSVKAAAQAIGCRHQTVSRLLHRADTRTTEATIVALLAALPPSLRGSA